MYYIGCFFTKNPSQALLGKRLFSLQKGYSAYAFWFFSVTKELFSPKKRLVSPLAFGAMQPIASHWCFFPFTDCLAVGSFPSSNLYRFAAQLIASQKEICPPEPMAGRAVQPIAG